METPLATSGIRFNDFFFSEPLHLATWTPPKCAGLFSILVNDPNWAPKAFQPLYFGELGNNSPASAVLPDCSPMVAAAKGKTLFVCVLPMPFSTTQQRLALRDELIRAYHPICQADAIRIQPEFKLAELMNPPADSPPVSRRRIGFVT
jgi:hypothetical protein